MDQEIEVGEIKEDGLRLWCARLALEYAKEEAKRLDDGVQRLKSGAGSLIGWTVTISIALTAVFFTHPNFQFVSLVMLICELLTAFFSIKVLYSTPWKCKKINLYLIQQIQSALTTELEIVEGLALKYEEDNKQSDLKYYKLQEAIKWAWIFFLGAPLMGIAVQMITFYWYSF